MARVLHARERYTLRASARPPTNSITTRTAMNKIIAHNLTAKAAYNVPGNPPATRPESGVANCYPGLEYDHRNLDRRFFPGLVFEFVSQGDATAPSVIRQGALLRTVDPS